MSTRSYSGLIVLEALYDCLPTSNSDLLSFADTIFTPHVAVVESDCMTTLGEINPVNYDSEGKVELATGNIISRSRIEQLLSYGIYEVAVRSLSTCISKDGVCQACYSASRQYETIPNIGSSVQIFPEYTTGVDVITVVAGDSSFTLTTTPDLYDRIYVYYEGALIPPANYLISDTLLNMNSPLVDSGQLTVRYTTIIRAPFLSWLASTYSGSILGIKQLPSPMLPVKKRLLASLVPQSVLEYLTTGLSSLKGIPPEALGYLPKVRDPLEKALLVIALYGVYLNVN